MVAKRESIITMPNGKHALTVDDLRVHTRDIISHFNASQSIQDQKIDQGFASVNKEFLQMKDEHAVMNTKLDAIMSPVRGVIK